MWQPIETYDVLDVKPERSAFYFKATEPSREGGFFLPCLVSLSRNYGNRVCTHWHPLADTDGLSGGPNETRQLTII
jgi:hypothetical protein